MSKEQENNDVVTQEEQQEESQEESSTQEEHETDTTTENEGTEEDESSEQQSATESKETPEQRLARLKRQYEREAKKQGVEDKKPNKKSQGDSDERIERLELKSEGYKSKKEQDIVLDYIAGRREQGKEIDVETALKASVVREDLAELRKKSNVPPPSGRSSNGQSASVDYYASQIKKGAMTLSQVESPEMRKQLRKMRIFS